MLFGRWSLVTTREVRRVVMVVWFLGATFYGFCVVKSYGNLVVVASHGCGVAVNGRQPTAVVAWARFYLLLAFWISISHWVVKGFDLWSHLGHRFMEGNMDNYFEPESEYSRMDYCLCSCLRSRVTCTCKNNSVLSKYLFKSYKRDYLFTIKQTSTTLPMTLPNQDEARYVPKKIRMWHITIVMVFFYKRFFY